MDRLILDIRGALEAQLWVLALYGALALPDVCAALASENGKTNGPKYKAWVSAHLGQLYGALDPGELYQIRCSMLHQARSASTTYPRIIFGIPGENTTMHASFLDGLYNVDLMTFVNDILAAVEQWWGVHQADAFVVENSKLLLVEGTITLMPGMRLRALL